MTYKMHNSHVNLQKQKLSVPTLLLAGELTSKGDKAGLKRNVPHYLFHYITSGSGRVQLETGQIHHVSAGDWFFAFPNQNITYQQNPDEPWLYKWLAFRGSEVDKLLARANIYSDTVIRTGEKDEVLEQLFSEMISPAGENALTNDLQATTAFLQLITRLIQTAPPIVREQRRMTRDKLQAEIDRACIFMGEHYPNGIGANEVALHIGFERSYFSKVFTENMGISIKDYLVELRVSKAKNLLQSSQLSVSEIGQAVGFMAPRTFSRFFKNKTGQTPSQFQRNANKGLSKF